MNIIKKVFLALFFLLLVLVIAGFFFVQRMKPDYEGEKDLKGLSGKVEVFYDIYGIPHIYGNSEEDTFRALGYVHAQDRLWQMELLRRVAAGGLAEVFGKDLIGTDKMFLALGIDDATSQTLANMDQKAPMLQISQAYLDGINQFVDEGPTPIEFYLTGIEKRSFSLRDILNSIGYMGYSFAMAQKTDPLLTHLRDTLGAEYLTDLGISAKGLTGKMRNKTNSAVEQAGDLTALTHSNLSKIPVPQFIGSNSWVIGPGKTRSGKVILSNDPHIGFAQPSVWYEAHLNSPGYEKYGYHLAGIPFPLLGHDRNLAYGITMFENDDIDFYYEELHPSDTSMYLTEESWKPFEYKTRTILVKGEKPVSFSYRKSRHGPVMNDLLELLSASRPISMSWTYTKSENKVMEALYGISHAQDWSQFRTAISSIAAPGLNMMYGDAQGNIAWWAAAKLYLMPDSTDTRFILEGSGSENEPVRYLDFSENPHAINPPVQFVFSANSQPDSVAGTLYPGYYLPENRADRIIQLLSGKNDWDTESTSKMLVDMTSTVNASIVSDLATLIDVNTLTDQQAKVLDILTSWKGDYPLESVAATVFHRWMYFFLKGTFSDELGEERFAQFLMTHFHKELIAPMARKTQSIWWDHRGTVGKVEGKKEVVNNSFIEAVAALTRELGEDQEKWTWDQVHTLEHRHPIGSIASLRSFFNVGPFPVEGSREVINNMSFDYLGSGQYEVSSGPSTRRVIDYADLENSLSILPTGQSGNPFSSHYEDQAVLYRQGKFRKMMMNEKEIRTTAETQLIFLPVPK